MPGLQLTQCWPARPGLARASALPRVQAGVQRAPFGQLHHQDAAAVSVVTHAIHWHNVGVVQAGKHLNLPGKGPRRGVPNLACAALQGLAAKGVPRQVAQCTWPKLPVPSRPAGVASMRKSASGMTARGIWGK